LSPKGLRAVVEIVIGDVHARSDALRALLRTVGVLDARGRRSRDCWVVQVGDLLDRRARASANLTTARLAAAAIDVVLAGNHEVRMLADRHGDGGAALATLAARGWPQAAAACGEWVITHAGVHPVLAAQLSPEPAECVAEINDRWHRRRPGDATDPLFDWIGPSRGGDAPFGGIFWAHPDEWSRGPEPPWGQVVGHVPRPAPRLLAGRRWAIDVGAREGRLAAVVRGSEGERWRPVIVADGVSQPLKRAAA
jgi:hypothetical protein